MTHPLRNLDFSTKRLSTSNFVIFSRILLFSDNVTMDMGGNDIPIFKGSKQGRIYLTTHRIIFNAKNMEKDSLKSFSAPFVSLNDVKLEQPTFGANYIKGHISAQENGGFVGEVSFKLLFKSGGAIDFGQALLRAAQMARNNAYKGYAPPPYEAPTGEWHQAPPPAYTAEPQSYGWLPQNPNFTTGPPQGSVFMTDNPPPYPGINSPAYPQPQAPGYPPQQQQQQSVGGVYPGLPMQNGYPDPYQAAYQGQYPAAPMAPGYPPTYPGAYYPPPPTAGHPGYGAMGYNPQPPAYTPQDTKH